MKNFIPLEACNAFLLRYHEIGLKGNNRKMFEKKFMVNIERKLRDQDFKIKFYRGQGRFAVHLPERAVISADEQAKIADALAHTFGLESFSPAIICRPIYEEISTLVEQSYASKIEAKRAELGREHISLMVRARRSWKKFPYTSRETEMKLADILFTEGEEKLSVDLKNPDFTLGVEVREDIAFVYYEKYRGPGGLPVGSSDPALALLSGGIDSPVACYHTMKRGAHCDGLTFHSFPYTQIELLDKIAEICKKLNAWSDVSMKLYACNMVEAQKLVRDNCKERFRTIIYRRMMMRVANVLADYLKINALVTGESLGQVASQTLRNMDTINRATDLLIMRPLVCSDKNDAIATAEKAGTFQLSSIQCSDSCTTFAPEAPATNAHYWMIDIEENKFDYDEAMRLCLSETKAYDILTGEERELPLLLDIFNTRYAKRWGQRLVKPAWLEK